MKAKRKEKKLKTDFFAAKPLIYLITDGELTAENFAEKLTAALKLIEKAVASKISLVQIREKQLSAKLVFEFACKAAQITKNSDTKLLINDRADIALAAKADGVHLTANSLSAETIRANFPNNFIIGVSTHSLEKAEFAKNQGADFATFSPIFYSPNKGKTVGLDALREVCEKLKPFPIIALGGIDETNYREVLHIADGFAAIRFLKELRGEFFV
ncbi:thiamine phosphate synthase [soil metagenome]